MNHATNLIYRRQPHNGDIRICLPINLLVTAFAKTHNDPMAGHLGREKTIDSINRYFDFPGLFSWITALIDDCV